MTSLKRILAQVEALDHWARSMPQDADPEELRGWKAGRDRVLDVSMQANDPGTATDLLRDVIENTPNPQNGRDRGRLRALNEAMDALEKGGQPEMAGQVPNAPSHTPDPGGSTKVQPNSPGTRPGVPGNGGNIGPMDMASGNMRMAELSSLFSKASGFNNKFLVSPEGETTFWDSREDGRQHSDMYLDLSGSPTPENYDNQMRLKEMTDNGWVVGLIEYPWTTIVGTMDIPQMTGLLEATQSMDSESKVMVESSIGEFYKGNISGLQSKLSSQIERFSRTAAYEPFPHEYVSSLGGSTGAQKVRSNGSDYVLKGGGSEGHILEESYADSVYNAVGVPVPNFQMVDVNGAPHKASEFLPGKTLDWYMYNDRDTFENVKLQLQQDFALDALLGNWDVIGLGYDNILVGEDGTPYRIDNGGSLRYRAQGAMKHPQAWTRTVSELDTMRDFDMNPTAPDIFEDLSDEEIAQQIQNQILPQRDAIVGAVPDDLAQVISERIDYLAEWAGVPKTARTTEDADYFGNPTLFDQRDYYDITKEDVPKPQATDTEMPIYRWLSSAQEAYSNADPLGPVDEVLKEIPLQLRDNVGVYWSDDPDNGAGQFGKINNGYYSIRLSATVDTEDIQFDHREMVYREDVVDILEYNNSVYDPGTQTGYDTYEEAVDAINNQSMENGDLEIITDEYRWESFEGKKNDAIRFDYEDVHYDLRGDTNEGFHEGLSNYLDEIEPLLWDQVDAEMENFNNNELYVRLEEQTEEYIKDHCQVGKNIEAENYRYFVDLIEMDSGKNFNMSAEQFDWGDIEKEITIKDGATINLVSVEIFSNGDLVYHKGVNRQVTAAQPQQMVDYSFNGYDYNNYSFTGKPSGNSVFVGIGPTVHYMRVVPPRNEEDYKRMSVIRTALLESLGLDDQAVNNGQADYVGSYTGTETTLELTILTSKNEADIAKDLVKNFPKANTVRINGASSSIEQLKETIPPADYYGNPQLFNERDYYDITKERWDVPEEDQYDVPVYRWLSSKDEEYGEADPLGPIPDILQKIPLMMEDTGICWSDNPEVNRSNFGEFGMRNTYSIRLSATVDRDDVQYDWRDIITNDDIELWMENHNPVIDQNSGNVWLDYEEAVNDVIDQYIDQDTIRTNIFEQVWDEMEYDYEASLEDPDDYDQDYLQEMVDDYIDTQFDMDAEMRQQAEEYIEDNFYSGSEIDSDYYEYLGEYFMEFFPDKQFEPYAEQMHYGESESELTIYSGRELHLFAIEIFYEGDLIYQKGLEQTITAKVAATEYEDVGGGLYRDAATFQGNQGRVTLYNGPDRFAKKIAHGVFEVNDTIEIWVMEGKPEYLNPLYEQIQSYCQQEFGVSEASFDRLPPTLDNKDFLAQFSQEESDWDGEGLFDPSPYETFTEGAPEWGEFDEQVSLWRGTSVITNEPLNSLEAIYDHFDFDFTGSFWSEDWQTAWRYAGFPSGSYANQEGEPYRLIFQANVPMDGVVDYYNKGGNGPSIGERSNPGDTEFQISPGTQIELTSVQVWKMPLSRNIRDSYSAEGSELVFEKTFSATVTANRDVNLDANELEFDYAPLYEDVARDVMPWEYRDHQNEVDISENIVPGDIVLQSKSKVIQVLQYRQMDMNGEKTLSSDVIGEFPREEEEQAKEFAADSAIASNGRVFYRDYHTMQKELVVTAADIPHLNRRVLFDLSKYLRSNGERIDVEDFVNTSSAPDQDVRSVIDTLSEIGVATSQDGNLRGGAFSFNRQKLEQVMSDA